MTQRECCILNGLKNQLLECQEALLECNDLVPESVLSAQLFLSVHRGDNVPYGVFQDVAGTVPATAEGHKVACWKDMRPGGLSFTQPAPANQPYLHFTEGVPSIQFSGSHFLTLSHHFNITQALVITAFTNGLDAGYCVFDGPVNVVGQPAYTRFTDANSYTALFSAVRRDAASNMIAIPYHGVMSVESSPTKYQIWNNGSAFPAVGPSFASPAGVFNIGTNLAISSGAEYTGTVWGIIIHDDPTKRVELENYLYKLSVNSIEPAAWEHWLFTDQATGVSTTPIPGLKSVGTLSPAANYTKTPNSIILPAGVANFANGFNTGFADAGDFTICGVFKRPPLNAVDNIVLFSNNGFGAGGFVSFIPSNDNSVILTQGNGYANQAFATENIVVGDWFFFAFRSKALVNATALNGTFTDSAVARTFIGANISVGNIYHTQAVPSPALEFAEVIIFNKTLTIAEIQQVYGRSTIRMAQRGIDIAYNPAAVVLIASTSKGLAAAGGYTDPINTTDAKLIVLNIAHYDPGTITDVEDSLGNTYIPMTPHVEVGSGAVQQFWRCENPITGPAHQFQINGASIFASVQVAAFDVHPSIGVMLDNEAGAIGAGTSINVGPVAQSTPLSLVVTGLAFSDSSPQPPTTDGLKAFTPIGAVPYIFGQHMGSAMAYKLSDSAIVHAVEWDLATPSTGIAAGIATFKREP
jgi:hypothetical protein